MASRITTPSKICSLGRHIKFINTKQWININLSHPSIISNPYYYSSIRYFGKKIQFDKDKVMSEMRSKYDRSKLEKDYNVTIPYENLDISCSRSSGPGGQNVNKVATKVEIRIDLNDCYWIPPEVIERLKEREKNRINKFNEFILVCDTHRTQYDNRNEANARLKEIIENCCYPQRERIESEMPDAYKELQKEYYKKKKHSKNVKKDMKSRGW